MAHAAPAHALEGGSRVTATHRDCECESVTHTHTHCERRTGPLRVRYACLGANRPPGIGPRTQPSRRSIDARRAYLNIDDTNPGRFRIVGYIYGVVNLGDSRVPESHHRWSPATRTRAPPPAAHGSSNKHVAALVSRAPRWGTSTEWGTSPTL